MLAATSVVNTRIRTMATIGREIVSAWTRSCSDCWVESWVSAA